MKHKILVAVDGKKNSFKIAIYAAQACADDRAAGVKIVLFHVLPRLPPHVESSKAAEADRRAKRFAAKAWEQARRMLAHVTRRMISAGAQPAAITTEIVDEEGDIAAQILEAAARHGCNTVVVARRSRSMIRNFLAGSVVERLLRNPVRYTIWAVATGQQRAKA